VRTVLPALNAGLDWWLPWRSHFCVGRRLIECVLFVDLLLLFCVCFRGGGGTNSHFILDTQTNNRLSAVRRVRVGAGGARVASFSVLSLVSFVPVSRQRPRARSRRYQ
jgi:hypothetical protein